LGPSDNVLYYNSDNDDCVIIDAVEGRFDDARYDRFDAAVRRLWSLEGGNHHFRMPADYDMDCRDVVSCTEFEQYVDAMANGKEASWS
jgi:hypothetical protein